jgi:hypothetical protein
MNTANLTGVRSTSRHAIHLQLNISTRALEIRELQSPKCNIWWTVDCTSPYKYKLSQMWALSVTFFNANERKREMVLFLSVLDTKLILKYMEQANKTE